MQISYRTSSRNGSGFVPFSDIITLCLLPPSCFCNTGISSLPRTRTLQAPGWLGLNVASSERSSHISFLKKPFSLLYFVLFVYRTFWLKKKNLISLLVDSPGWQVSCLSSLLQYLLGILQRPTSTLCFLRVFSQEEKSDKQTRNYNTEQLFWSTTIPLLKIKTPQSGCLGLSQFSCLLAVKCRWLNYVVFSL